MNKWQQAFMDTAERFGALSTAERLKVGAIIVKDGRIISIGYNGMPAGWDNVCEDDDFKTKPEVIHAEANAIAKLASSHESGCNAYMYVTHAPCIECAKLISTSGISRVYYKTKYRNEDGLEFLRKCNVEIIKHG
jgi:dCMP deaminase